MSTRTAFGCILILAVGVRCFSQTHFHYSKQIYVDHGDYSDVPNPPCGDGSDRVKNLASELLYRRIPNVPQTIGFIFQATAPQIAKFAADNPGLIGKIVSPN